MIVTVASGKGGTGKTTVAVSLALVALPHGPEPSNLQVHLLDCDVEAPNAALFLHPHIDQRREVGLMVPHVDRDKCTFCGRCAEVCQYNALAVLPDQVLVFPELCHGCGSCALNCPEDAISENLRVSGVIERGQVTAALHFAQGTLNVGEAMAVPIIRQLKQWAIPENTDGRLVILDAPPGTSCPVVETMRGSDVALLVTEPTPFGLHDLRLTVEVARDELGIPVVVLVNRDGVGDEGVDDYCREEGIPVVMRIPMDRRIAEAYSEGTPIVAALPEYHQAFARLHRCLLETALQ